MNKSLKKRVLSENIAMDQQVKIIREAKMTISFLILASGMIYLPFVNCVMKYW